MKVKITEKILDYDLSPLKENEIKISQRLINDFQQLVLQNKIGGMNIIETLKKEFEKESLTYRVAINYALNTVTEENGKPEILSAADKAKCYEITKKIFASKEVDLTPDQISFILQRIDKIYISPIICGRVKELFNK